MKAEKRLLGQNFTPGANSLLALVKHSGLMVLVCHCHVTSSAGCFVTEMVRRLGTVTLQYLCTTQLSEANYKKKKRILTVGTRHVTSTAKWMKASVETKRLVFRI